MSSLLITSIICYTLYKITCVITKTNSNQDQETLKSLLLQTLKNQTNMSESLDKLTDQVNSLQASLDTVQEAVVKTIADLNAQIEALKNQLATGATAEELQVLIDKLAATKADLESTLS